MNGETRREKIKQMLQESSQPLTGTALANALHVSRQVIVQDIALMRAEQLPILSTNKGYLLRPDQIPALQPKRVFFVRHTTDRVMEEFMTVIDLGGRILDVSVEHDLYGPIRADLLIENVQDAADFAPAKFVAVRRNMVISLRKIRKTPFFGGRSMIAPTSLIGK